MDKKHVFQLGEAARKEFGDTKPPLVAAAESYLAMRLEKIEYVARLDRPNRRIILQYHHLAISSFFLE